MFGMGKMTEYRVGICRMFVDDDHTCMCTCVCPVQGMCRQLSTRIISVCV